VHELSLALSIVEIAEEEVKKAGQRQVETIVLEIGTLAGVEKAALDFAWQEAVKHTVLEQAECIIEDITARARCLHCNREFDLAFLYDLCPFCSNPAKELIQGNEIRIKSLTTF
jgi:hydrogenase nickel incorporation protein HypA/HybF